MIVPVNFGLKYRPLPKLGIQYHIQDQPHSLFVYEIPLSNVSHKANPDSVVRQLFEEYGDSYLNPTIVSFVQLKRLVEKVLVHVQDKENVNQLSEIKSGDPDKMMFREDDIQEFLRSGTFNEELAGTGKAEEITTEEELNQHQSEDNEVLDIDNPDELAAKGFKRIQIEGEDEEYLMDNDGNIYDLKGNFIGTTDDGAITADAEIMAGKDEEFDDY